MVAGGVGNAALDCDDVVADNVDNDVPYYVLLPVEWQPAQSE